MNNEPVAWKQIRKELNNEGAVIGEFTSISTNTGWEELPDKTPLYTHPAKTQELDCYGDGNVYRGVRSKDSETKTYVFDEHAGKQVWSNPAKTLTDEEIAEIINEHGWRGLTGYLLTFAHAILRKAQEK